MPRRWLGVAALLLLEVRDLPVLDDLPVAYRKLVAHVMSSMAVNRAPIWYGIELHS
jgi:hypothetical protein